MTLDWGNLISFWNEFLKINVRWKVLTLINLWGKKIIEQIVVQVAKPNTVNLGKWLKLCTKRRYFCLELSVEQSYHDLIACKSICSCKLLRRNSTPCTFWLIVWNCGKVLISRPCSIFVSVFNRNNYANEMPKHISDEQIIENCEGNWPAETFCNLCYASQFE